MHLNCGKHFEGGNVYSWNSDVRTNWLIYPYLFKIKQGCKTVSLHRKRYDML